jgi:hypothetical protein
MATAGGAVSGRLLDVCEKGETLIIRAGNLEILAAALVLNREKIAKHVRHPPNASGPQSPRAARSQVANTRPGAEPPSATRFSPRALQSLSTAFRVHEARRYTWICRVTSQAPLPPLERIALACVRQGIGARFVLSLGATRSRTSVTVHAIAPETTSALQACLESGASARLTVRVAVVEKSEEHATLKETRDVRMLDFHKRWRGFASHGFETPVPWALVVEEVAPSPRSRRPPGSRASR